MGNASSGLPFDIGEEVKSFSSGKQTHWKMHKGTKRTTGEPVTIFRLNKTTTSPLMVEAGKRGLQKIRTLKHPFVLTCLEGVELETELLLATEPVMPLREWLAPGGPCEAAKKDDQVAWGLRCLCSALKFLHEDCKVSHSNLCADAVFVTAGGDWKLGGLDLLGPIDGSDPFLQLHHEVQPQEYRSPERQQRDWRSLAADPIHCMDIWALGVLMGEVYRDGIPDAFDKYVQRMQAAAKKRPTAVQYLRCAFLKRPVIGSLEFLDAVAIKTPAEKTAFFEELKLTSFSTQMLEHKVARVLLGELESAMNPTGGSAASAAAGGADSARAKVGMALPLLLEASKILDDAWFENRFKPQLVALFALNDRGVRVVLLSRLDAFGDRLDQNSINNKIFDPLCAGFTDAAAALRELTLKSMVVFIDKLNERNLNDKLVRHLSRLQGDQEDSIRTNTIIFFGKVAKQLKPAVRDKLLLPAFARGIKDPFPAARLAGLRAATACQALLPAAEVCYKVLPSVMPCLIDPASASVREAAFACVELYIKRLTELSAQMKVDEEERRQKEREEGLQAHLGQPVTAGAAASATATSVNGPNAQLSEKDRRGSESGWGTWAIGMLTEKLAGAVSGEIGGAPESATSGGGSNGSSAPPAASMSNSGSPVASPPVSFAGAALGEGNRLNNASSAGVREVLLSGGGGGGGGGGGSVGSAGSSGSTGAGALGSKRGASSGGNDGWGWGNVDVGESDEVSAEQRGLKSPDAASPPNSGRGGALTAAEKQRRRQELEERRAARRTEKKKGMVLSATKLDGTAAAGAAPSKSSAPLSGWEDF